MVHGLINKLFLYCYLHQIKVLASDSCSRRSDTPFFVKNAVVDEEWIRPVDNFSVVEVSVSCFLRYFDTVSWVTERASFP